MDSENVLISGCSSGIGRETALAFLEDGWEVYATGPELDALDGLAERGCATLELNVTDTESVNEAVDHVLDERGRVDCLINNAGYGQLGPLEDVPVDRLKRQFEVNTFGAHRLTRAVLPSMRERNAGTVINNSSIFGRMPMIGQGSYVASKHALEGYTDTLRAELSEYDIDVVLIEPGPVDTRFGETALREKAAIDRSDAYEWFDEMYDDRTFIDQAPGAISPDRVARTMVRAATSDAPLTRYLVGPHAQPVAFEGMFPDKIQDLSFNMFKRFLSGTGTPYHLTRLDRTVDD